MDIEEEITKLKGKIERFLGNLPSEEKEILKKICEFHAQNIHIKSPRVSTEIVKIVKERIKE